ncbi:Polyadenylate-binding protein, cytoplasmic and nuclear-like protein [Drosera capensis]
MICSDRISHLIRCILGDGEEAVDARRYWANSLIGHVLVQVSKVVAQPRPASLYVGDLDPRVTTADLFHDEKVTAIHACTDAITGESLCYGYVTFGTAQDVWFREDIGFAAVDNKPYSHINAPFQRSCMAKVPKQLQENPKSSS